jgi:hypothetical protein
MPGAGSTMPIRKKRLRICRASDSHAPGSYRSGKKAARGLFIEIKDPERYPPDLESSLLSLVRGNHMEKRTISFLQRAQSLRKIKEIDASIPIMLLISKPGEDPVKAALEIAADELGLLYKYATPAIVNEARIRL